MLRQRHAESKVKESEAPVIKRPRSSSKKASSTLFFIIIFTVIIILYVIVPVTFYMCPAVRRHAVFLHYVSLSPNKNLSEPSAAGLNCTRNFYVQSDDDIKLGAWHIPSMDMQIHCRHHALGSGKEFSDTRPVFLYLHGNAGTRGGSHRVELYKVLSEKVNAHIVAFDYRGYGDSSNVSPSQTGIISDSVHVYEWLRKHVSPKRIFIWGHSLGTGVATAVMDVLSKTSVMPMGFVLEAPFTKLIDAVKHHPLSFLHRYMPFFDFFFTNPIGEDSHSFDSVSKIGRINSPVLILHAEDDGFVPFFQGKQLYEQALSERTSNMHTAQFIPFEGKLGYGHKNIYKDPLLPTSVIQFIEHCQAKSSKT